MPRRMMTEAEVKVVEEVEQKLAGNKVQSDFSVGEIVLYKGNKYPIENLIKQPLFERNLLIRIKQDLYLFNMVNC